MDHTDMTSRWRKKAAMQQGDLHLFVKEQENLQSLRPLFSQRDGVSAQPPLGTNTEECGSVLV